MKRRKSSPAIASALIGLTLACATPALQPKPAPAPVFVAESEPAPPAAPIAPLVVDTDLDGIHDKDDACPTLAGVPSQTVSANGCPAKVVVVVSQGVVIVPRVEFTKHATTPTKASLDVIDEAANVMKEHTEIKKLLVIGNAALDEKNPDALSLERAEVVIERMVKNGVARERLEARGDGTTRPLADNKTADGRARNRRVMFEIVEKGACAVEAR